MVSQFVRNWPNQVCRTEASPKMRSKCGSRAPMSRSVSLTSNTQTLAMSSFLLRRGPTGANEPEPTRAMRRRYRSGAAQPPPNGTFLLALYRLDLREVHFGIYGFVHVVRKGGESNGGDHLHDLLVAVADLLHLVERIVRGVPAGLYHVPGEPEGSRPLFVLGLEPLRSPDLVLAHARFLRHGGVDRQSVRAAVVVRGRDVDGLVGLLVEGAALERLLKVHIRLE